MTFTSFIFDQNHCFRNAIYEISVFSLDTQIKQKLKSHHICKCQLIMIFGKIKTFFKCKILLSSIQSDQHFIIFFSVFCFLLEEMDLCGSWRLETCKNFEKFLHGCGVNRILAKLATTLTPTEIISVDGDQWTIK